jgi:hypothetical protein
MTQSTIIRFCDGKLTASKQVVSVRLIMGISLLMTGADVLDGRNPEVK